MSNEEIFINRNIISNFRFQFLFNFFAGAVLVGVTLFPSVSWGDVEGQNLRSSTLRQYDFLIARVNKGESFDPPSQKVVDKISENLETLSSYQIGSIKNANFEWCRSGYMLAWKIGEMDN